MNRSEKPCRDCRQPTSAPALVESGAICRDCKTKYLRTKPIENVETILRLAREYLTEELRAA